MSSPCKPGLLKSTRYPHQQKYTQQGFAGLPMSKERATMQRRPAKTKIPRSKIRIFPSCLPLLSVAVVALLLGWGQWPFVSARRANKRITIRNIRIFMSNGTRNGRNKFRSIHVIHGRHPYRLISSRLRTVGTVVMSNPTFRTFDNHGACYHKNNALPR